MRLTRKQYFWFMGTVLFIAAGVITSIVVWQNSSKVLETANSNTISNGGGLPISNDVVPIRTPLEKGEADHISIPGRGIEAPVVYVDEDTEAVFQEALARGVVHYPGTALPGELGNPYIFGHSSDYRWKPGDYKQVFKPLVDIPLGTVARITNSAGELFIYKVIETKIVGPKDVSVLDQANNERYLLTLQTSWPVGTALKRFIAVFEMDEEATFGPSAP